MQRSSFGTTTDAESAEREKVRSMTTPFADLVRKNMKADPGFADELRAVALDAIRSGDVVTGRSMLKRYFGETEAADENDSDAILIDAK